MCLLIQDKDLLKRYYDIWNKVRNSIEEEFDREPMYRRRYLKFKIKSYVNEATDFHDKRILEIRCDYTCLAAILIDFVLKKYENYYLDKIERI